MNDATDPNIPLGQLLGLISGALRQNLLAECPQAQDDVRLVGLAMAIDRDPTATQADHARGLGIDLNTASRLVKRAETMGLLTRTRSSVDARAHTLTLTKEGSQLSAKGAASVRTIEGILAAQLGDEEMQNFRKTALRILELLV